MSASFQMALNQFCWKIIAPLNALILRIHFIAHFQVKAFREGFYFYFRPFIYGDILMFFLPWEEYVKKVFKPKCGEVIFDIGSYIGKYTLMCAKFVGKNGLIVAFEPDEESFLTLKKNIEMNQLTQVKIFNTALGKTRGTKEFYVTIGPAGSSLLPRKSGETREKRLVSVVPLDDVVNQVRIEHIDWVKIDVEGSELDVLKGGEQTFTKIVDKIIIETKDRTVLDLLSKWRFNVASLGDPEYMYFLAEKQTKE